MSHLKTKSLLNEKNFLSNWENKKGIGTAPTDPNLKTFKKCTKIEIHI